MVNLFLRYRSLFTCGHEEIDARASCFQAVVDGMDFGATVGGETINEAAPHVVHFDFNASTQMLEVERHLAIVRIRNDFKANGP